MKKTIQFTKIRFVMISVSLALLGAGLTGTILRGGFNLGIDFRAGLSLQVEIGGDGVGTAEIRQALSGFDTLQVQELGAVDLQRFSLRIQDNGDLEDFSNAMREEISAALVAEFGPGNVEILADDYVEPRFAKDLAVNATLLVVVAMAFILLYLWVRFRFAYAISSLAALVHDIAFMVLFIGSFQIEVTSATIAAVLTIIGYSLNDTIVIFDRIRENEKLLSDSSLQQIVNVSVTQSLSRTIITSLTTLLAVTSIYIFTTGQIQNFALNMIVGVLVGTYSSIFIASPALMGLSKGRRIKAAPEPGKKGTDEEGVAAPSVNVDTSAVKEQLRAERQRKKRK